MTTALNVTVVGAGAVGVSIAADLAERGIRVTLVDAGHPGTGTSSASFGWLNSNGKEPHPYFDINRLGLEAHHRLAENGRSWLGAAGHIEIATDPEHQTQLALRVERLHSRDYPAEFISQSTASALLPGIRIPADADLIAHFPRETYAYPSLYIASALDRARAAGARMLFRNAVTMITPRPNGGATVQLADGTLIRSDVVVSALGRWSADLALLAGVETPMQTYSEPGDVTVGYLVETTPVPVLLDRIVTSPRLNLRPEGGGRLLLQALDLDETADPTAVPGTDSSIAHEFLRRVADIAIGGEFARVNRLTVGQRAIPADGHTIAGYSSDASWLYIVATHSGVTLAPFLGESIADELTGTERIELASFRPDRFQGAVATPVPTAPRTPGQQ